MYELCTGRLPFHGEQVQDLPVDPYIRLWDAEPSRSQSFSENAIRLIHDMLARRLVGCPTAQRCLEYEWFRSEPVPSVLKSPEASARVQQREKHDMNADITERPPKRPRKASLGTARVHTSVQMPKKKAQSAPLGDSYPAPLATPFISQAGIQESGRRAPFHRPTKGGQISAATSDEEMHRPTKYESSSEGLCTE